VVITKQRPVPTAAIVEPTGNDSPKPGEGTGKTTSGKRKARAAGREDRSDDDDSDASAVSGDSDVESGSDLEVDAALKEKNAQDVEQDIMMAEEEDLPFDDDIMKKERLLETKSKITHPVHCPYFPMEKYEWWWVYLCDKKRQGDKRRQVLKTSPAYVTSLVDEEEIELKFPAPPIPGQYTFQVCVRSDSYMDCDQMKEVKFTVHPAKEITSHPQWDFPSEEEDKESGGDVSDGSEYTEEESAEED
jgi:translocation protein SEC63